MAASKTQLEFHDHLPLIEEKLGGDGLIGELCKGFELLMDANKGVITFDSLKNNALSPDLMDQSEFLLEEALEQEFKNSYQ
ncbi:EF-hand domain pair [Artemisia annua]|uniref:EF-hand domain pair n=1 Tax=Artemisia annua TaxID=35608 RepID=A0A2U1L6M4_ARTAN|nr:EF-hand domain pair [Artemisia annua]PWA66143.1 EF-hand domain pair [Artemisia annua]